MSFAEAVHNHENVPPDYYETSIKSNLGQRFWHYSRFSNALRLVKKDKDAQILDIGSADGTFTKILINKIKPKSLVGIDVLKTSVDYANRRFRRHKNIRFRVADAHDLPFKDQSFTGVFCLEVLEHIFKPKKVISEIYRVLKPNGYVIVIVPNEKSYLFKSIWWVWTKFKGRIWQHSHVQEFTPPILDELFKKGGFKVEGKAFLFNMLYILKGIKLE